MKENKPIISSKTKKEEKKKIILERAEIENPGGNLIEYPLFVYNLLYQQMKKDFGEQEDGPNDNYDVDSSSSDEEVELTKEEEEILTNNPKKLKELQQEKLKKKQERKQYKLWRKKKSKSTIGKCQVCVDDSLNSCQNYFGYFMLLLIISSVIFMFFIKAGQETFTIQDENEAVDYYSILEIPKSSTPQEVKKAYRKGAIKWHPDRNRNCGQKCLDKMNDLSEAYIILSNPETRAFHDKFGVRPPQSLVDIAKAKHGGRGAFK